MSSRVFSSVASIDEIAISKMFEKRFILLYSYLICVLCNDYASGNFKRKQRTIFPEYTPYNTNAAVRYRMSLIYIRIYSNSDFFGIDYDCFGSASTKRQRKCIFIVLFRNAIEYAKFR